MTRSASFVSAPLSALLNAVVFAGMVAIGATTPHPASAASRGADVAEIEVPGLFPRRDRAALVAIAQSPQASLHDRAIAWHGLAGQRVEGAAHTAVQLLDEAGAGTGTDPLMKAYLGSAYIMRARDQSFVPARIRSVRRGLTILTEAVNADPGSFEVRSLRAATTMNLPDIFDYRDQVRADLSMLIGMIEAGKAPAAPGSDIHGRFILALAKACAQDADAACAVRQIDLVRTRFGADPDLAAPAAALEAALGR